MAQITVLCNSAPAHQNWWPIVIGGIQFLVGIMLTAYTFRKSFQQKEHERRVSWYHKVVVDKAISLLSEYQDGEASDLEQAALDCDGTRAQWNLIEGAVQAAYSEAVTDFQQRLKPVRRELTNLALIFDRSLFERIQRVILALDDEVSACFYLAVGQGFSDAPKQFAEVLSNFHRDTLKIFRDFEFYELPKISAAASSPFRRLVVWFRAKCDESM